MPRNVQTVTKGTKLADYASPGVSPSWLKQNGYAGVVRYVDGTVSEPAKGKNGKTSWKCLTVKERDRIIAAGLGITLVFERYVSRPNEGAKAGIEDGVRAKNDARALGYPTTELIIVAVDTDITAQNVTVAAQYCQAFAQAVAPHPVGVYGDYDIIDRLNKDTPGKFVNWQANAAGWSGIFQIIAGVRKFFRRTHPAAHVLQQTQIGTPSGAIDPNTVLRPFQIWKGPLKVLPPAVPVPTLRVGSFGPEVRKLQNYLKFLGWYMFAVDGDYGPRTADAVKVLQRKTGQVQDGVYGPKTAAAFAKFLGDLALLASAK